MKISKKASMQLSINAIVILVMAMAVLGLGLGLVRGLLTGGVDKLEGAIGGIDLSQEANAGKPLANVNNIRISRGGEEPIAVSFYNTNSDCTLDQDEVDDRARLSVSCQSKDGSGEFELLNQTLPVDAPQGQPTKLGGLTNFQGSVGTYACTVSVSCSGSPVQSEAAFVEVTN